jgi:hypothetical protein
MACRFWKAIGGLRRVAATVGLGTALVAVSGPIGMAQSNQSASGNGLVGAWMAQVTLRDCTTGAALAPPFNSLVTHHRGGTFSESPPLSFAIGQRSDGHGVWDENPGRPSGGRQNYSLKFVALIHFDTAPNLPGTPGFNPALPVSPGFFAGWQIVTHTVQLIDADHSASQGTNAFYKLDGTLYRTGCSSAVGRRFQ